MFGTLLILLFTASNISFVFPDVVSRFNGCKRAIDILFLIMMQSWRGKGYLQMDERCGCMDEIHLQKKGG